MTSIAGTVAMVKVSKKLPALCQELSIDEARLPFMRCTLLQGFVLLVVLVLVPENWILFNTLSNLSSPTLSRSGWERATATPAICGPLAVCCMS